MLLKYAYLVCIALITCKDLAKLRMMLYTHVHIMFTAIFPVCFISITCSHLRTSAVYKSTADVDILVGPG